MKCFNYTSHLIKGLSYAICLKRLLLMKILANTTSRSNHQRCSLKKVFLQICNIHRKTPVLESLFNKVDLKACGFIKKSLQHSCFPVNIASIFRTSILTNTCKRLLQYSPHGKSQGALEMMFRVKFFTMWRSLIAINLFHSFVMAFFV